MIEVKDFRKSYSSNKFACDGISFRAKKGEIVVLLGPNGAGKTTLLKAIAGAHYATSGNIFITAQDGRTFDVAEKSSDAKRITGFVGDEPFLYDNFTVEEFLLNVAQLRIQSSEKSEMQSAILRVVKLCALEDVLFQKVASLSHGYKQRVNFAQAIVHAPEILILDEPTTGLDPSQIREMRNLIKNLKSSAAIIFSTHIIQEAENLADEILIINGGKIVASGTVSELVKNARAKNLEEAYLFFTENAKGRIMEKTHEK
ncbi:MAG: ABC transporter ATP-binding protein [Treponema sp.]|nr:ABC transporter ATP-binding protein [Treponema sp.]